jgi:hypothetical protein
MSLIKDLISAAAKLAAATGSMFVIYYILSTLVPQAWRAAIP